jgi:hypothetical protein
MAFLIVVGVLQFTYCVVAGNYVRASGFEPSITTERGVVDRVDHDVQVEEWKEREINR